MNYNCYLFFSWLSMKQQINVIFKNLHGSDSFFDKVVYNIEVHFRKNAISGSFISFINSQWVENQKN